MIKTEVLEQQVLLQDMDKTGLNKIAKIARQVACKKGEPLFKEKDATQGLWLIQSGKIEISRVTADGWRQTLVVFRQVISLENYLYLKTENMWHLL